MNQESTYLRNNIEYRIVSSRSLSDYKNCQAFMLGELVCGKHRFSSVARDIALLYYDNWFKFCNASEQYILRQFIEGDDNSSLGDTVTTNMKTTVVDLQSVMGRHPSVFSVQFVTLFRQATKKTLDVMEYRVKQALNAHTKGDCFKQIVATVIDYLNSVMYTLHEIDCIFALAGQPILLEDEESSADSFCSALIRNDVTTKPFVCVSNLSAFYYGKNGEFLEDDRLELYLANFPTLTLNTINIKCYVPVSLTGTEVDSMSPTGNMVIKLSELLKSKYHINDICFE